MKALPSFLLGAACALAAAWLTSAAAPQAGLRPTSLRQGNVIFGLQLMKGLDGLEATTPVTIRDKDGPWLLIDYPTKRTGPIWVNTSQIVSLRTDR